jgi:hypothetical protein
MSTIVTFQGQTRCFSTTERAIDWAVGRGSIIADASFERAVHRAKSPAPRDQSEDYCRHENVLAHTIENGEIVGRRAVDVCR